MIKWLGENRNITNTIMDFNKNTKYFLIGGWSLFFLLILISDNLYAGDNHVHIEQVTSGDDLDLTTNQVGTNNEIRFSIDHNNNTFNLQQYGANNKISWVPYWGSGKSWGGDVDGVSNTLNVEQHDGATYGGHIWGNSNQVDIYQNGTHTHYLDIHVDSVEWQEKLKIKQNSLEQSLLEYEPDYIEGVSRLACQIQLNDDLNNVTVKLRKHELL